MKIYDLFPAKLAACLFSAILGSALQASDLGLPQSAPPPLTNNGLGDPVFLPEEESAEILLMPGASSMGTMGGSTFYDHGDPTDYEQLMLELVNRARADPAAEAARHGIGLNEGLDPGTIADTPKQPLGSHRFLIDAARAHSQWMLDNNIFSHTGADGSSPSDRALTAGYPSGAGENIAWGGTTGTVDPDLYTRDLNDGLFVSPGHRQNICFDGYREIGLGILLGEFTSDGTDFNAMMATQNFGSSHFTPWPFVVGVAYYDFNSNGVYDADEGIGGVEVNIAGGSYHTSTASAGGYTLPRPAAAGVREITMTAPSLEATFTEDLPADTNHKVDLALSYEPPVPTGTTTPAVDRVNHYALSPVPGATSLVVKVLSAVSSLDDGANDLSRVTDGTSGDYAALSTTVKYEGGGAYHLAHPVTADQILEYEETFRPGPAAAITFRSRLGLATTDQIARVEVSSDGGGSWVSVYHQAGSGDSGESTFHARAVSLAAFAGQLAQIRFNYHLSGGGYYGQTYDGVGWYVDAIHFQDIETIDLLEESTVDPGADFDFLPSETGTALLLVQPRNLDRWWPTAPPVEVEATAGLNYSTWAQNWEIAADLPAGHLTGAAINDIGDNGVPNMVSYALALDPTAPAGDQLPAWVETARQPAFEYTVDTSANGATVTPQLSVDLEDWYPVGAPELGFQSEDQLVGTSGTVETRRIVVTDNDPNTVFARVRVTVP